jgi:hypothetical protein
MEHAVGMIRRDRQAGRCIAIVAWNATRVTTVTIAEPFMPAGTRIRRGMDNCRGMLCRTLGERMSIILYPDP